MITSKQMYWMSNQIKLIFFVNDFCSIFFVELLIIVQFVTMFLCVVNIDIFRQSSITVYVAGMDILIIQCGCIVPFIALGSLDWIKVCKASSKVMYQLCVY